MSSTVATNQIVVEKRSQNGSVRSKDSNYLTDQTSQPSPKGLGGVGEVDLFLQQGINNFAQCVQGHHNVGESSGNNDIQSIKRKCD